jgi:hypothetical protein
MYKLLVLVVFFYLYKRLVDYQKTFDIIRWLNYEDSLYLNG